MIISLHENIVALQESKERRAEYNGKLHNGFAQHFALLGVHHEQGAFLAH